MRYSYECWPQQPFRQAEETVSASAAVVLDEPLSIQEADTAAEQAEGLRELEQNLPFTLEEGLHAYRQHQAQPQVGLWTSTPSVEEAHWNDFAKLVADHVLAYMLDNPLQEELASLRQQGSESERETRRMARQIQELALENSALKVALHKAEQELAQFIPVAGGFFKKGD
ncbi:hypothetical protein [Vampirovibrio chlorellavorus]|uniref:hypothetical protein n=1 Tax=Vampirovibrio chlorellavorus TaxID=758823 RepID=UPI0026EC9C77|nr:hypothetical protein [Vampirovibrio chlorellavorus]